jgi:hypothetical protein
MKTIYLASPFFHASPNVRWARAEEASFAATQLMLKEECAVFCPVAHGFHMHQHLPEPIRHDHEFWLRRDLAMLPSFDALALLPLSGWRESLGVQRELTFARNHEMPIILLQDFKGKYLHLDQVEMEKWSPQRTILIES